MYNLYQVLLFLNVMGSRDDAVVRALTSHQCGPGSIPGFDITCVVGSGLCSERFFSGFSGFPNSNSIWNLRAIGLSVITDYKVSPLLNKVDLLID